jgi:hypothetical protein
MVNMYPTIAMRSDVEICCASGCAAILDVNICLHHVLIFHYNSGRNTLKFASELVGHLQPQGQSQTI